MPADQPVLFPARRALPVLPALLFAASVSAQERPQAWKFDPVHTRVMFAISHAGFSQAIGTVPGSDGGLLYEPGDWTGARVVVEVPLARLELGDADWNRAALAPNLLDARQYPVARFVSTGIVPVDANHAEVCGGLTLRGITRPLCMDVTVNAVERHPMPPFRLTAGFSATASLSRADFGIDAWPSMIGDRVELRIEAEATRASDSFAGRLFGDPAAQPSRSETETEPMP